ncbi:hypothetical protein [Victivallis vadensis]|uniref:hypothetical protein n=1 Tax=Victivallis vadensis TaxID=172901 RepID=UPI003C6ED537
MSKKKKQPTASPYRNWPRSQTSPLESFSSLTGKSRQVLTISSTAFFAYFPSPVTM